MSIILLPILSYSQNGIGVEMRPIVEINIESDNWTDTILTNLKASDVVNKATHDDKNTINSKIYIERIKAIEFINDKQIIKVENTIIYYL